MASLSQETMISRLKPILSAAPEYQKVGTIDARPAKPGELIITATTDGKETENVAQAGDYVVVNPGGEEYILTPQKMQNRYQAVSQQVSQRGAAFRVFAATGKCYGVVVDTAILKRLSLAEDTAVFEFEPSWGGSMVCRLGDMLVTTNRTVPEVYRIAIAEFKQTYHRNFF